jgi:hypothetical protein
MTPHKRRASALVESVPPIPFAAARFFAGQAWATRETREEVVEDSFEGPWGFRFVI